jgi:hypothetical protein
MLTDSLGSYRFSGLDSGSYSVHMSPAPGFSYSLPQNGTRRLSLGLNESLGDVSFGMYYPWNSVSGSVFEDLNENGVYDSGEKGLEGFCVQSTGSRRDSAITDSLGRFFISHLIIGFDTVALVMRPGWEEIVPIFPSYYEVYFDSIDRHFAGRNFALRRPPRDRVKIKLSFFEQIKHIRQDLFFGVRSGATTGICGASAGCSLIDCAEGEIELPPFNPGFFDARFTGDAPLFGEGSWSDIREFVSESEIDTYRVRFSPGYLEGGKYPVLFSWDSVQLGTAFSGSVEILDRDENRTDMKTCSRLFISDSTMSVLRVIAAGPQLGRDGVSDLSTPSSPQHFQLLQNYPNPFNPCTRVSYVISSDESGSFVSLKVYDILGREVATLVYEKKGAGEYSVIWNAGKIPGGVYFYRLTAGSHTGTKKMILMR